MHPYFGRHFREVISSVLTLIAAGGGLYLAWTESAVWLNRAGAAVIIIGVLAATSRFQEWIEQKADSFVEEHFEPTTAKVIAELESLHGELPEELKKTIRTETRASLTKSLEKIFDGDRRRIKSWEVGLVILGTFLNGFGDWLVNIAKSLGI